MENRTLLKLGLTGSIVTAICCFTPTLAWLLAVSGLAAWLAWLDYVLLPLLVVFLGLTAFAFWRARRWP
jgi:mercuric ion transport protein